MTQANASRRALLSTICMLTAGGVVGLSPVGCGGKKPKEEPPPAPPPPPPPQPPARLNVAVKTTGNANAGGLPIVVRVYELKAQGEFTSADFFSLYDNEAATLADALVSREEMTMAPGQSRSIDKELSPDARYLGVLGAFRNIDTAQWRRVVPLAGDADNRVSVTVGSDSIQIESL